MRAQSLCAQLTAIRVNGASCGLHVVHRELYIAHLQEVQTGVRTICGVMETLVSIMSLSMIVGGAL